MNKKTTVQELPISDKTHKTILAQVEYCAELANISLNEEQTRMLMHAFQDMLLMFKTIEHHQNLTLTLDPLSVHSLRDDMVHAHQSPQSLISNSEDHDHNYVILPNLL